MLELALLGLLKERGMHGYELRKELSQKLGFFWQVSFGSLYPTLRRLERRGAVRKTTSADHTSRRKQVYEITATGEREFLELLEEGATTSWEEDKFPLRLAFFRYLGPETRIRLLERRKAYLRDKLDEGERSLQRAKHGRADGYTLSLMRHGMEATRHDIDWLDELVVAERRILAEQRDDAGEPPATDTQDGPAPEPPDSGDDANGEHPSPLQTH